MQMQDDIIVWIMPHQHGMQPEKFSASRRHDTARIYRTLRERCGDGYLKDMSGRNVLPDEDEDLEPGQYRWFVGTPHLPSVSSCCIT